MERVSAATTKLHGKMIELFAALATALEEAEQEVTSAKADWKAATDPQRDGHAEVLRKLVEDGHDPDKYLTTTKALEALKAKEQRRPGIATRITTLQTERTNLLGQLAIIETRRSEELNKAIRQANAATNGVVVVRPIAAPDRKPIKSVVERHVKGARTQIMAVIDADNFSPRTFVAAVQAVGENLRSSSAYAVRRQRVSSAPARSSFESSKS